MSNPRPRPKVMMLTEAAAERIKAIMAAKGTNVVGPRIGVKKGGCAGMEYTMAWVDKQEPFDEVVEDKGASPGSSRMANTHLWPPRSITERYS